MMQHHGHLSTDVGQGAVSVENGAETWASDSWGANVGTERKPQIGGLLFVSLAIDN